MTLRIGKPRQRKNNGLSPPLLNTERLATQQRTGFTFIEIVLVATIILVLAGLSIPLFRKSFTSIQLKNTTQHLVQLMRYIQAKAIAERRVCRINFDSRQGSYWQTVQDQSSSAEFKKVSGKWGLTFKVPQGISINAEEPCVTFYPDGSSDGASLKLTDQKGRTALITTQKGIGYVKVEE